jgi:hypothetical protein
VVSITRSSVTYYFEGFPKDLNLIHERERKNQFSRALDRFCSAPSFEPLELLTTVRTRNNYFSQHSIRIHDRTAGFEFGALHPRKGMNYY